jgi:hypothetical protein
MNAKVPSRKPASSDVDAFLGKVAATRQHTPGSARGRLLFAMDATASRQPTWDRAANIQGEMFNATSALGGLDVQLAFFRGFGEFRVSQWTSDASELLRLMTSVACFAGETQVLKVLKHALNESRTRKVNALVYVGDSMEEDIDALGKTAGELGLNGVPAFMFLEGNDPVADYAFREIARLTGGACVRFDAGSAEMLKKLLGAVAVFAAGGHRALGDLASRQGGAILSLTQQLKKD